MEKTETIHIRISPVIKKESEKVLNKLGLNFSYAISSFLAQVANKKKIPFDLSIDEEPAEIEELAFALNKTDGSDIDEYSKNIIHLYSTKQIDYETALFALKRNNQ